MEETNKTSFLGTGWDFPPTFKKETRGVALVSDIDDINSSLNILLSTRLRERILQPGFGCNLSDLVFEPVTLSLLTMVENMIKDAVIFYEPRIKLLKLELESNLNEGMIEVRLNYMVRGTNSRFNYVYPFYLKEGTEIQK